jgi:nucleotide-binding universal stress UspA family protein
VVRPRGRDAPSLARRLITPWSQARCRHGVTCEVTEIAGPHVGIGQTLLAQITNDRADLLVMGCYGHSRLRELVFGGASRHVLQHMNVPVLMSH